MNTKLHAVTDTNGRPISFFMTAGQVSDYIGAAALLDELPKANGGLPIAAMPTDSAMLCRKRASPPASRVVNPGTRPSNTTKVATGAATGSRSCSTASRTGGGSRRATTGAPTPSSRPLPSLPPSSSGSDQRVLTLGECRSPFRMGANDRQKAGAADCWFCTEICCSEICATVFRIRCRHNLPRAPVPIMLRPLRGPVSERRRHHAVGKHRAKSVGQARIRVMPHDHHALSATWLRDMR